MQVECPAVTPEVVLAASGHVERFTDLMVTDAVTGDCHRADHLLEAALEARLEDTKSVPSADEKRVSTFHIFGKMSHDWSRKCHLTMHAPQPKFIPFLLPLFFLLYPFL